MYVNNKTIGVVMDAFLCPVCEDTEIIISGDSVLYCKHCGARFEKDGREEIYELDKKANSGFLDKLLSVRSKAAGRALSPMEWDRLAGGERSVTDEDRAREEELRRFREILTVTTPTLPNAKIIDVQGDVHGFSAAGIGALKDFKALLSDTFGGPSETLQQEMNKVVSQAIDIMKREALARGANAIIGIKTTVNEYRESMMIATAEGTAVTYSSM
jgi:uncharacterized protein YbjQ (UPF0145 family)/transcription elongation factor Elf1